MFVGPGDESDVTAARALKPRHDIGRDRFISVADMRTAIGVADRGEIGRAQVCTTVTNEHIVCRISLENNKTYNLISDSSRVDHYPYRQNTHKLCTNIYTR